MLASTILFLVAVPWIYCVFDDLREYFKKLATLYVRKSEVRAEVVSEA